VNVKVLEQAIRRTFERRSTPASENHSLFKASFYRDEERNNRWKAWLRKAKLDTNLELHEVMDVIGTQLKPIYSRLPELN